MSSLFKFIILPLNPAILEYNLLCTPGSCWYKLTRLCNSLHILSLSSFYRPALSYTWVCYDLTLVLYSCSQEQSTLQGEDIDVVFKQGKAGMPLTGCNVLLLQAQRVPGDVKFQDF